MRIDVPGSAAGLDAFADFYRFPAERAAAAPLVVWIGGAISRETYEARRASEPGAVLAELAAARARIGDPPCDVLVLSAPPTLQDGSDRLGRFERLLGFELFPLLPLPRPPALGLVGNSFGAYLATGFAWRRPDARALATIAGVGLWTAVTESGGDLRADLAVRCFTNDQDFAGLYALELQAELAARGRTLELVERPGDHPFADYAENGSVADAFAFVLERCGRKAAPAEPVGG